jgi:hypothetical protein
MKPVAQRTDRRSDGEFSSGRSSPMIDFDYQTFSLDRFNGGSGGSESPSFFNISRDYFQREARRNFLAEVAFFIVFAAVLAGAVVETARVIIHTLQLPSG